MKKAFMKSRFYIGIALLVQTVSMIVLFFSQWKKRKSLSAAFLAIGAVSGAIGGYLVATGAKDEEEKNEMLEALREDFFEIDEDDISDEEDAVYCTGDCAEDADGETGKTESDEKSESDAE